MSRDFLPVTRKEMEEIKSYARSQRDELMEIIYKRIEEEA